MTAKVLIVDDDPGVLDLFETLLEDRDFELLKATNGRSALSLVDDLRPNLAIIDIRLQGTSGLELLKDIKLIDSGIAVIMMTGYDSTSNAIEAMRFGAFDYITKPFDIVNLLKIIDKALASNLLSRKVRVANIEKEISAVGPDEDLMIGSSPEMVEIWKMVGKVADSGETVLIAGESGTGKELMARAIYNNSSRVNKPFLSINCGALSENLLESELFGHEKGAFTDAHTRRIGKFEQCHTGTLFLDEISELSLAGQSKLLRVLENHTITRVGGNKEFKVDVRIIAATNRSLINEVKDGRFRLDLYYRLRVISLFLPPLRERASDIPLLIDLFTRMMAEKSRKIIRGISPEVLAGLTSYAWPGNIRELKNAINSAVVLAKSEMLDWDDFSQLKQNMEQPQKNIGSFQGQFTSLLEGCFAELCQTHPGDIFSLLSELMEKNLASNALRQCQNNQVAAAKLLGVSRNTLRKWVELGAREEDSESTDPS